MERELRCRWRRRWCVLRRGMLTTSSSFVNAQRRGYPELRISRVRRGVATARGGDDVGCSKHGGVGRSVGWGFGVADGARGAHAVGEAASGFGFRGGNV